MKISDLIKMGFQKCGSIIQRPIKSNLEVDFEFEDAIKNEGCVYLWVEVTDERDVIVLYCGRTMKGIKNRMGQHKQGFKGSGKGGSKSGEERYDALKGFLKDKKKIEIWTKTSSDSHKDEKIYLKKLSGIVKHWLCLNRMS
jgi:hypothetical protein